MKSLDQIMARLGELERRLANLARPGTVSAVDLVAARVRVRTGDLVSAWLPWLTWSTVGDRSWHAPAVGEQALLISPSGDPAQGLVLPAIYATAAPPPASSADITRLEFKGGVSVEIDRASGTATLVADLVVDGTVTVTGDVVAGPDAISLINHVHGGVTAGPVNTGAPVP